jgi:hypothetical protein
VRQGEREEKLNGGRDSRGRTDQGGEEERKWSGWGEARCGEENNVGVRELKEGARMSGHRRREMQERERWMSRTQQHST